MVGRGMSPSRLPTAWEDMQDQEEMGELRNMSIESLLLQFDSPSPLTLVNSKYAGVVVDQCNQYALLDSFSAAVGRRQRYSRARRRQEKHPGIDLILKGHTRA